MFGSEVDNAIKQHALREYPKEACGLVAKGVYYPMTNVHLEPTRHFQIAGYAYDRFFAEHGMPYAVVHSHIAPNGNWPSAHDMASQQSDKLPWGIVATDGSSTTEVSWFGEHVLDEPLIGRSFLPGVRDCYAIIRAYYKQTRNVVLPDFPRDSEWWRHGGDLFREGFEAAGFHRIEPSKAQPGDVVLMQIRCDRPNHGAVLLSDGLMLHHTEGQYSRREPVGRWTPYITHWLRHKYA